MQKKLTNTVDAEVYDGLHGVIGQDLSAGYAAMAADAAHEAEAAAWSEGLVGAVADERRRGD